eukprot:SAG11_NODE_24820_length_367_cov_2.526119_1_plen_70_part_10
MHRNLKLAKSDRFEASPKFFLHTDLPVQSCWSTNDVKRFKDTFEDKRLKEGGCHETTYKSGIIEVPDTVP